MRGGDLGIGDPRIGFWLSLGFAVFGTVGAVWLIFQGAWIGALLVAYIVVMRFAITALQKRRRWKREADH